MMITWVKELLSGLDEYTDEVTKRNVLRVCGEKCPFTHLPDDKLLELKGKSASDKEFLQMLCDQWRLYDIEGQFYVIFDQCYCPLVKEDLQGTSRTLCYCTLGNIEHKFRLGLERDVEVILEKSILAGDEQCQFKIILEKAQE